MVKYIYHILKNLFQGYNYIKHFSIYGKYNYRILKHGVNLFQGYNYIKHFSIYGKYNYRILKNLFQGYNYIKDFSIYDNYILPYIEKSFPRL